MWVERIAAVVLASTLVSPAFGQRAPYALERYRVTLKGGGLGIDVDETVIVSVVMNAGGEQERWAAERLRRDSEWCGGRVDGQCPPDKVVHSWIDGKNCPALYAAFDDLAKLKMTGFAPPARSDFPTMTDTPLLTVSGKPDNVPGFGAHMSLSGFSGPMVDWWNRSEQQFISCWTDKSPEINGHQLEANLSAK